LFYENLTKIKTISESTLKIH